MNKENNTNKESQSQLFTKMMDLEFKIISWGESNSQSNPGAMMDLRDMKRELNKIKIVLGLK
jgi:hypothetical protein